METLTLTKITHLEKDKQGNQLTSKQGKPYTRCLINTNEYGEQPLSGFGSQTTRSWQEGQKVELEVDKVEKDGRTFLNFKLPKGNMGGGGLTKEQEDKLDRIEHKQNEILAILHGKQTQTEENTPQAEATEEINPDDIPF